MVDVVNLIEKKRWNKETESCESCERCEWRVIFCEFCDLMCLFRVHLEGDDGD